MRIVVAPDKFKGSLSAPEVARHLAAGLTSMGGGIDVVCVPVADGGEGTLDASLGAGYQELTVAVTGPTGQPLDASFGVRGRRAVIEMALASGLAVLPAGVPKARAATSRGTGELIRAALGNGCRDIVLGIGGSASTDGGAGLLAALGVRFLDADERTLPDGGVHLNRLARVDLSGLDPRVAQARFVLASDVGNPLLGERGAAAVFGPQKGASAQDVAELESALTRLAEILGHEAQAPDAASAPGSGAAGGVGYAALAVLGAERRPGIDVVLDLTELRAKLRGASLVVTGEGSLDGQSLEGKAPLGVASAAREAGIPVWAVCGRSLLTERELGQAGLDRVFALADLEHDPALCMDEAAALTRQTGALIAAELLR